MKLHAGITFAALIIATIVIVDVAFFRNHFTARLITNVGIVALYAGIYIRFFKK